MNKNVELQPGLGEKNMSAFRTSIKDIAKIAGVTDTTVSRAFTSPEKVKKETREKILKIATELNYTPSLPARSMRSSSSKIIGLIADDIFNPVYSYIIKELNIISEKNGYSIMVFNTNGCLYTEERAINTLLSHNAAGVIIAPINDNLSRRKYLDRLIESNIEIIQFDRQFSEKLPGVFIDSNHAGKLAGSQAIGDTLIVGGPRDSEITRQRIDGILHNLPKNTKPTIIYSDYHFNNACEILKNFRESNEINFDCIISVTGLISLAILSVLHKKQKATRLISIDEIPLSEIYGLEYIYINHDYKEWAHLVAENLFNLLNKSGGSFRFFIKGKLNNNISIV